MASTSANRASSLSLNEIGDKLLRIEAQAAIKEVAFAVKNVVISKKLPNDEETMYMNLETKESETYCVEFTALGLRVSVLYVCYAGV